MNNNCSGNLESGIKLSGGDFLIAYNNTINNNRVGIDMLIDRSGHFVTEIVSGIAIVYNKLITIQSMESMYLVTSDKVIFTIIFSSIII